MANNLIENAAFACGEYDKVMEAGKYTLPDKGCDFKEVEGIYGENGLKRDLKRTTRICPILPHMLISWIHYLTIPGSSIFLKN
jgi:hypothetical protein